MLKLIKYEIRKTLPTKLICLGLAALVQALMLYGIFTKNQSTALTGLIVMFLGLLGAELMMGIGTITTMHRDMNTKQSYMLFMTPNSTFKILGAKVIESLVSIMIAGAVGFGICMLDMELIQGAFGNVNQVIQFLQSCLSQIGAAIRTDLPFLAAIAFRMMAGWVATVTCALLADVISASLLSGKKFSGLLTFLIFVVLLLIMGQVETFVGNALGVSTLETELVMAVTALAWSALMYVIAAVIMDRRLSV